MSIQMLSDIKNRKFITNGVLKYQVMSDIKPRLKSGFRTTFTFRIMQ